LQHFIHFYGQKEKMKVYRMKFIILLGLSLIDVIAAQTQNLDSIRLTWQHYSLANGLQVILQQDQTQTDVSVEFWVKIGIRDEVPGKHGFAHFFEHATPYGLREDEDARNLLKTYRTGSNAQTRRDYIRYFLQVKADGVDIALRYSADRFKAASDDFQTDHIDRHKTNVLNEMKRNSKNPFWAPLAENSRKAGTFGQDHYYGHSGYGTFEENETFSIAEMKDWYNRYFNVSNAVLFIVGNFETDHVKAEIERQFGSIKYKKTNRLEQDLTADVTEKRQEIDGPFSDHLITITWPVAGWGSTDAAALRLLSQVLEKRLANGPYKDSGSNRLLDLFQHAGQFGVYSQFEKLSDSQEIEQYLKATVNTILKNGISEAELNAAKHAEYGELREMQKTLGFIGSRTELLGEGLLFSNNPDQFLLSYKQQIELQASDINAIAEKYLSKPSFVLFTRPDEKNSNQ
ncbi:MAG: insulinase family protein, partial [Calditrichaeota bacterium]|nr:insulinase family protein [Calditrichota bacterium]